jgi:hypothetical protein
MARLCHRLQVRLVDRAFALYPHGARAHGPAVPHTKRFGGSCALASVANAIVRVARVDK